ncbi:nitrate- and nitrite sensing domain-containing protein [Marinactinospora rubrisoli]|uniref:histidine kinase n=1 Tax=Marinactinospora rubrisoli TaxID=2715399 RepID=A0ABW2KPS9_9ACTN
MLIPSITFLLLFLSLSGATLAQAFSLRAATAEGESGVLLFHAMVELQQERRLAAEYLAAPSDRRQQAFQEQVSASDEAIRAMGTREEQPGYGGAEAEQADALFALLDERPVLREEVTGRGIGDDEAIERYSDLVERGHRLYDARGRNLQDGPAVAAAATAADLMHTQELLARSDALLSAGIAAGELTPGERNQFTGLVASHQAHLHSVGADLTGDTADTHEALHDSPQWAELAAVAQAVSEQEPEIATDPVTGEQERSDALPAAVDGWREAADTVDAELIALADLQVDAAVAAADSAAARILTVAIGGGVIAMIAGTLAYAVASRSAGRLTHRLARLRADTLSLANDDLPKIVRRLQDGEPVDVDRELTTLDYGADEVGQVADAFNNAQRTAVSAAVKQAEIRAGVNRVFLGIAHRNQSLVQRQLQLLDRVEREEDDPDLLEDLFQLDHLATRGRRNAENLIILGGAQPGRRWRNPIPLVDILRGAVSETEEYARVKLRVVPTLTLRGAVVADIIHLVAELVENATAFSPPHTKVDIHSEIVPKGVVVEIEDRGLGMSEEDYAAANRTLSHAPEFDVMALNEDSRLGLFVVARLAAKHDIAVQLCPSPYGGTRAVILIPAALIATQEGTAPTWPARPAEPAWREGGLPAPAAEERAGDLLAPQDAEAAEQRPGAPLRLRATPPRPAHDDSAEPAPDGLRPPRHARPVTGTSGNSARSLDSVPYNGTGQEEDRSTRREQEAAAAWDEHTTPPEDAARPPLPARRPRGVPAPAPADTPGTNGDPAVGPAVGPATTGTGGRPPLPKRRRQTHLAPQLRDDHVPTATAGAPARSARSPEDVRRMLSAFQSGTRRARETEDGPAEWPAPVPAGTDAGPHSAPDRPGGGDRPADTGPADGRTGRPSGDHSHESE